MNPSTPDDTHCTAAARQPRAGASPGARNSRTACIHSQGERNASVLCTPSHECTSAKALQCRVVSVTPQPIQCSKLYTLLALTR